MAEFSFPCLSTSFLDSNWLPDFPISVLPSLSGFVGDFEDSFFSCYSSDPHHDIAPDVTVDGENCSENKYRMISSGGGDVRESSVIEPQSSDQVTLKKTQMEKIKKNNDHEFKDVTQGKDKKRKHNKETPTDYVHVRARRGEATDKHSLAERARREKISKKMKQLQALIPGSDQVEIGASINSKVLLLDAVINHVQSLQNQVEYLSMKLASMNHMQHGLGEDLDDFMDKADLFIGDVGDHKQMSITRSSPGFDDFCNF